MKFIFKPTTKQIALRYLKNIEKKSFYEVKFKNLPHILYWPLEFNTDSIYQITSETFDSNDWHYYQKKNTQIEIGDILLDIGTAEGLFPLAVVDKCSKIFLIEPSKLFFKSLAKTFEPFKNKVKIHNVAVGDKDGTINFSEESLIGRIREYNEMASAPTNIMRIDSIIPENQAITYIKADIEGYEYQMLRGAELTIKNNMPKIAITTYHKENDAKEIIELILSYVPQYNYSVKGIFEDGCKPVMIHFWIDRECKVHERLK